MTADRLYFNYHHFNNFAAEEEDSFDFSNVEGDSQEAYELENVMISSYQVGGSADGASETEDPISNFNFMLDTVSDNTYDHVFQHNQTDIDFI